MFGRKRKAPATQLRHVARERGLEPAGGGCSETIDAVDRHLTEHVGPVETVFHEIVSDLVHIDIHVVPADEGRPFHALMTSGMSDRPMHVPAEVAASVPPYAELMILLPPDWPLDQASWQDERFYWPVRHLKVLARLPHEYDTWLGVWHSVPNGDPPQPFAGGTAFCASMLAPPMVLPPEFRTIHTEDGREISVLAVIPLLPDELKIKLERGVDALLDGFDAHGVNELFDPARRSSLRR